MVLTGLIIAGGVFIVGKRAYTRRQKRTELSLFLNNAQNAVSQPLITGERLVKYGVPVTVVAAVSLSSYGWFASSGVAAVLEVTSQVALFMRASAFGPLLYTLAYVLRPIVLFPAAVMAMIGGYLYGPVWGVVYAVIGELSSAALVYRAGRYSQSHFGIGERSESFIARYAQRLRQHPFASVLVMRIPLMHYDLVSYVAGVLQIEWRPFILGTVLGSILLTIPLVFVGASVSGLSSVSLFSPPLLIASGTVLAGGLITWYIFKLCLNAPVPAPLIPAYEPI